MSSDLTENVRIQEGTDCMDILESKLNGQVFIEGFEENAMESADPAEHKGQTKSKAKDSSKKSTQPTWHEVTFGEFLERFYLEWQLEHGRASIREFARWLGINHTLVIQWMNGKGMPGGKYLYALLVKIGPDIYNFFEYPVPPTPFIELLRTFENLPKPDRDEMEQDFDEWFGKWLQEHGFKRIK